MLRSQLSERAAPSVPDHMLLHVIGHGAYGEVWLARNVVGTLRAVKVVHRADFSEVHPFEREFKGIQKFEPVSRGHPGFVDILQIGRNDAEGYFYYVMELADGVGTADISLPMGAQRQRSDGEDQKLEFAQGVQQSDLRPLASGLQSPPSTPYCPRTLRSELRARGRLPVEECARIALALADALAHLHREGLVHRDIKPSNIIFVDGAPKLADIGLVANVDEARSFVGTEGFIPPEGPGATQADLFSLGKVLYEMSMGRSRLDFPALPADWDALPELEQEQLAEFNAVLMKAGEVDLARRYCSAEELCRDLEGLQQGRSIRQQRNRERFIRQLRTGAVVVALVAVTAWLVFPRFNGSTVQPASASPTIATIAVLPFDEEGAAAGDDLTARLTEEIRAGLTRVPGLGVIKRRSSEELKQSSDPLALARSNGISAVLEGQVRRAAGQTLVSLELTETRRGRLVWSASKEISDPITLAVFVVQSVVDPLQIPLSYSQRNSLTARPTENLKALQLYWEARVLLHKGNGGLEAGLPLLYEAVKLDTNFALAYADIAGFNITLAEPCPRSGTNFWMPAKIAAERAYVLAPNSMEANLAMAGLYETFEYDWAEAEKHYLAGIQANPASGETHWIYGLFLDKAGRADEARKHRELALVLDPLEPMNAMNMGHQLFGEGRHLEALTYYQKSIAQQPHPEKSLCLGNLYLAMDRAPDALRAYEEYLLGSGITADSTKELRAAHTRSGWTAYWEKWLQVMEPSPEKYYRWSDRARIHDRLGQTNDVIACLKKSIENREFHATGIRNPNSWKPYRTDPRFEELLRMLRVDETGRPRVD